MSQLINAQIEQLSTLSSSVFHVLLTPEVYVPYKAGQYLEIKGTGDELLFYSIANAPNNRHYELHVQTHTNMSLLPKLKIGEQLQLHLPFGNCTVDQVIPHKPLILIAGGTGFAPMKAIIEEIYRQTPTHPIILIWACKTQEKLYMHSLMNDFTRRFEKFQYIPCITSSLSFSNYLKKEKDNLPLKEAEIILAGPFEMVYAVRDELLKCGLNPTQLHADAFSFTQGTL